MCFIGEITLSSENNAIAAVCGCIPAQQMILETSQLAINNCVEGMKRHLVFA